MYGKRWLPVAGIVLGLCMVLLLPTVAQAGWVEGWYDDLSSPPWLKYEAVVTTLAVPGGLPNGEDVSYFYSPPVPDGMDPYEWKAEVIKVEAIIFGLDPEDDENWLDLTSAFSENPGDAYDEGIAESLPFSILHEEIHADYPPGKRVLDVILDHGVVWNDDTDEYQLCTSLTDVVFGKFLGAQLGGFRATFQTGIKPVPEPGTLALFGTGALVGLIAWRRRRK